MWWFCSRYDENHKPLLFGEVFQIWKFTPIMCESTGKWIHSHHEWIHRWMDSHYLFLEFHLTIIQTWWQDRVWIQSPVDSHMVGVNPLTWTLIPLVLSHNNNNMATWLGVNPPTCGLCTSLLVSWSVHFNPHYWCNSGVLVVNRWCNNGVLLVYWWFTNVVLMVYLWCTGRVLVMYHWCNGVVLVVYW
jgi:hypothetical protein